MLEWLFRPQCAACGAAMPRPAPLCAICAASLVELGPACPRCAEPVGAGPVGADDACEGMGPACRRCRDAPLPLERIAAPWRFGGQLATAIRRLKFAGRTHVARD